jgi:hypothetical protein
VVLAYGVQAANSPVTLLSRQDRLGCHLTTLFGNAAITTTIIPAVPAVPKKQHNLLPVLIVLFLISYGLMTMLIVEQGRTIESQRALIHELFHDSAELAAVKSRTLQGSAVVDTQHEGMAQVQAPTEQASSAQIPSTQIPSVQIPSTQAQTPSTQVQSQKTHAPSTQIPSTQVTPRNRVHMPKPQVQAPSRPASDLADDRRAVRTI